MSLECSECERDLRGGHDKSCSHWTPEQELCTCDPEWNGLCPVHGWDTPKWLVRRQGERER